MSVTIKRTAYADMFGPTTGDRVRLADTDLIIEVEKDFTTYGEEVKFGGGKVIRDGMGQSQLTNKQGAVDTVITNALILDHWGIVKADVGIKDGDIELNAGRKTVTLTVTNTGDRPIQVGSHYHFFETNPALKFERKKARGMRLDIAAGTAVRFEPGQTRDVTLVAIAGKRTIYGFRQDIMGKL